MWQLPARLASFLGNMEGEKNAWHQTLLLITYNIVSVWDQALLLEWAITW